MPTARMPSGNFLSAASCSSARGIVRTASARGISGSKSTNFSVGRRSIGSAKSGSPELRVGVPALGRRLVLRPPLRAALHPRLAQLLVWLVLVVGAELHAAARTDRIGRRAGHVDGRLGQAGKAAHRTGKRLGAGRRSTHNTTPDFLAARIRAHAAATASAARTGSSPRGLMLEMTSRSASVAPLAGL